MLPHLRARAPRAPTRSWLGISQHPVRLLVLAASPPKRVRNTLRGRLCRPRTPTHAQSRKIEYNTCNEMATSQESFLRFLLLQNYQYPVAGSPIVRACDLQHATGRLISVGRLCEDTRVT